MLQVQEKSELLIKSKFYETVGPSITDLGMFGFFHPPDRDERYWRPKFSKITVAVIVSPMIVGADSGNRSLATNAMPTTITTDGNHCL